MNMSSIAVCKPTMCLKHAVLIRDWLRSGSAARLFSSQAASGGPQKGGSSGSNNSSNNNSSSNNTSNSNSSRPPLSRSGGGNSDDLRNNRRRNEAQGAFQAFMDTIDNQKDSPSNSSASASSGNGTGAPAAPAAAGGGLWDQMRQQLNKTDRPVRQAQANNNNSSNSSNSSSSNNSQRTGFSGSSQMSQTRTEGARFQNQRFDSGRGGGRGGGGRGGRGRGFGGPGGRGGGGRGGRGGGRGDDADMNDFGVDGAEIESMFLAEDEVMSMGQLDMRKMYDEYVKQWTPTKEGETPPAPLSDFPAGKSIKFDTSGMDPVDAFFFESFVESLKTSDGSFKTIMKTNMPKSTFEVPQARSIKQLIRSKTPRISTAKEGTSGHAFSTNLWTVMSCNPFFTEVDKESICNRGAWKMNQLLEECEKLNESHPKWAEFSQELTIRPGFRKGLRWIHMEEDERRVDVADESLVMAQGETNWDQEAVVNEDDFK